MADFFLHPEKIAGDFYLAPITAPVTSPTPGNLPQLNLYTIMRDTPINLSVTMGGAINLTGKLL